MSDKPTATHPHLSRPDTIVPTVEYQELYRTFVEGEIVLAHLDRVGWPRSMNAVVENFRRAIESYRAARLKAVR